MIPPALNALHHDDPYTHVPLNAGIRFGPERPLVCEVTGADTVVYIAVCYGLTVLRANRFLTRGGRLNNVAPVNSRNGEEL